MASIRRKARSPYWFACFALPDGSRTQRSTKTTDKKKALRLANSFEDAAKKRVAEGQARRILSDIHEMIHGTPISAVSYTEYLEQWLGRKKMETVPVTYMAYVHALNDFATHLGSATTASLQYITTRHISAWRDKSAAKATNRTANNKLKILRTLFQSAWRDGLITENPAAKVPALKTKVSNRRPFSIAEIQRALSVADSEWRGMILIGFYTGQRLKDIALLTWENVDIAANELRFVTSKTSRRQAIPLASPLANYLGQLPAVVDPSKPLFPAAFSKASRNRDTSALSQEFHTLLVRAGLANERPSTKQAHGAGRDARRTQNEITFHSLRHTATSLLKATGAPEAVARDIVGHESEAVSRQYTHVDMQSKRAAVAALPSLAIEDSVSPLNTLPQRVKPEDL